MRILSIIGALIGFLALGLVIYAFEPQRIAQSLTSASPQYIIGGLLLVQVQIVASALRWRFTAERLGQRLPVCGAVSDYYLGSFLNQILPGGVAGDAVRAVRNRGPAQGGWKLASVAVLLERGSGQAMFFFVAALGLAVWPIWAPGPFPAAISQSLNVTWIALCGLAAVGILLLAFRSRLPDLMRNSTVAAMLRVFVWNHAWAIQTGLSLLVVGSYIGMFMLASSAVGAELPAIAGITVIPLCLLMMLIPATVAGWGAREAAAAMLWPLFGYSASEGVAASVLYGVLALAGASPGMLIVMVGLGRAGSR